MTKFKIFSHISLLFLNPQSASSYSPLIPKVNDLSVPTFFPSTSINLITFYSIKILQDSSISRSFSSFLSRDIHITIEIIKTELKYALRSCIFNKYVHIQHSEVKSIPRKVVVKMAVNNLKMFVASFLTSNNNNNSTEIHLFRFFILHFFHIKKCILGSCEPHIHTFIYHKKSKNLLVYLHTCVYH